MLETNTTGEDLRNSDLQQWSQFQESGLTADRNGPLSVVSYG